MKKVFNSMSISIISGIVLNDFLYNVTPELPVITNSQVMPELTIAGDDSTNMKNIINLNDDEFMEMLVTFSATSRRQKRTKPTTRISKGRRKQG